MTTLILRLRAAVLLLRIGLPLIQAQNELITELRDELRRTKLEHNRELLGMVSSWLIHHETPEIDLREDLSQLATNLGNQIAKLEEHVV